MSPNTYTGNVVVSGVATNCVMTTLSRLNVNASSPPERIAGAINGSVIWKNARRGVAYRSAAACSSWSSMPAIRALTMSVTTAELKIA